MRETTNRGPSLSIAIVLAFVMGAIFLSQIAGIAERLSASTKANERIEAAYGTPTAIEAELPGYIRGHCGSFTAWTAEYLTADSVNGKVDRSGFNFLVDASTPAESRATHATYLHSGYDVGHMPAAANHQSSEAEMRACFLYSAMMPQTPELNRGADAWAGLEDNFREVAASGAEVWLFTGPAFLPDADGELHVRTLKSPGGGAVWIPTHCWKAALVKHGPILTLEGYLMPNVRDPPSWKDCCVPIDEIEAAIGGDLFNRLPDDVQARLEAIKGRK